MGELLDGPRARACPTAVRQSILERAEGIPLYAVETVRMLARSTAAWSAPTAPIGPSAT